MQILFYSSSEFISFLMCIHFHILSYNRQTDGRSKLFTGCSIRKGLSLQKKPAIYLKQQLYRQGTCFLCLFVVHLCENPFPCLISNTEVLTTTLTGEPSKILSAALFGKRACLPERASLSIGERTWYDVCFSSVKESPLRCWQYKISICPPGETAAEKISFFLQRY